MQKYFQDMILAMVPGRMLSIGNSLIRQGMAHGIML